jgi:hypothetical protein
VIGGGRWRTGQNVRNRRKTVRRVLYRSPAVRGNSKSGDGVVRPGEEYFELIAFSPGEPLPQAQSLPESPRAQHHAHDVDWMRKFLGGSLDGSFTSPAGNRWKIPPGVFAGVRAEEGVQLVVTFRYRK